SHGGRDPQTAILDQRPDGSIGALSSNGADIYTVRLAPLSCTCPGFVGYGHCYHSTAAQQRYGVPVHQHADGTIHALGNDGQTRYAVVLGDAPSCTCPDGKQARPCCHLATALSRYAAFYTAPWA